MKLSYFNDTDFKLFINNHFIDNVNYDSKEQLMAFLKNIILKIKKAYNVVISGFYEVNIYIVKNIGIIFIFKKCDNYTFSNKVIDLKMTIELEPSVYLKFDNYDYISDYNKIRYNNGFFYLDVLELEELDVIKLSDYYTVVIDDDEKIGNFKLIK